MGKLNINNGGVDTNKKMADIDERFGPYTSIEAANAALGGQGRNTITAGLTVGILQANGGVKEYWYQPNKNSGLLELIPKGGNAADNPTEGNFASFDENGNVVDSGNKAADFAPMEQAVPMGDTEDVGKVLEKKENGFGWVDKPVDGLTPEIDPTTKHWMIGDEDTEVDAEGKSALQIYNKLNPEAQLDEAGFISKLQQKYPMIHVGYYSSSVSKTVGVPFTGDLDGNGLAPSPDTMGNLYIMPNNDPTPTGSIAFTTVNTGENTYAWVSLGAVDIPDNALTEEMVDNECTNGTVDTPASAKAVMDLKAKLEGVTASETKVQLVEDTNWHDGLYLASSGVITTSSGTYPNGLLVINVGTAKKVRFLGYYSQNSSGAGYGFSSSSPDISNTTDVQVEFVREFENGAAQNQAKEYIVDVPEGKPYFVCTIRKYGSSPVMTIDSFYCYLQSGTSVGEELANKASYSDMEGLWMWKKNLLDKDNFVTGYYYLLTNDEWIQENTHGIVSQPLHLVKGVTYTASNVALQTSTSNPTVGDTNGYFRIAYYNANDVLITVKSIFNGKIEYALSEGTSVIKSYGTVTFIYNEDGIEEEVAYVRINIQGNANLGNRDIAQLEVGNEKTNVAPYHSEKVFNIATKEYVDEEVEELKNEINGKIGDVIITETEVDTSELSDYTVNGNTGYYKIDGTFVLSENYKSVQIGVSGYDKVRFLGYQYSGNTVCYGFQDSEGNVFDLKIYDSVSPNKTKEYSLLVPNNAKYLICIWVYGSSIDLSDFYCYLQKGLNIEEKLTVLEDNTKEYVNEDIGNDGFITIQGKRLNYEVESGINMEVSSSNTNYATSYRLYPVEQGVKYLFSGAIKTSYNVPRYPIIFLSETTDLTTGYTGTLNKSEALGVGFGDKDGKIIGKPVTLWTHVNEELKIPEGCNTIAINIWTKGVQKPFKLTKQEEIIFTTKDLFEKIKVLEANGAKKTRLKVMAIGNSFTVDSVAYLPYLVHHFAPEVDFDIDLLMESSSDIACQILDYLHARHNENVDDEYKYPHVVTRTDKEGAEGKYMYQDGRSYRWFHYDKEGDTWEQKYDNTQNEDTNLFTIQSVLLHNNEVYDVILINSSYWTYTEGYNGGYNPNVHGFINLISEDLNYPVKFGSLQTFSNLHSLSNEELQWDENKIFDSNGNYISDIEYNNGNFVEYVANLFRLTVGTVNNVLGKSIVSFKIPVNTAFNNAYTWDKIRSLGSFNNGNHDGYLRMNDSATHLMHGLPRQLAAYTCMLKLLELVGINQKSIIGDTYMLNATTLNDESKLDLNPPSGDNIGFDGEDKFDNLKFIQKCAVAAVNNPDVITNINAMHDDVCYIQFNLQEVDRSDYTVTVKKGSLYSTTLSPNTNSYVFDGEVEVYMNNERLLNVVSDNSNGTKTVTINSVTGDVVIIAKAILSNT